MKLLIFGDIYGRIGRAAIKKELPILKKKYDPDFTIVNVDNISSGRGAIEKHLKEIDSLGVDIITGGDHIFDNMKNIKEYIEKPDSKLIRPANFFDSEYYTIAGKGYKIVEKNNKKLLIIHLFGQVFTHFNLYNPFLKADEIIKELGRDNFDSIIIDFHKEATSEGYGMGFFLDGKVSLVYGTHTHVQTNDEIILPLGTGLISDVGMCGPLYSVIGADYKSVEKRFLTGLNKGKLEQCLDKNYVVSGICVHIDDNGNCSNIEKIRIKGKLL